MRGRVGFAVPGDLDAPTGGYAYDRRMIAELRRLGWQVDPVALGDGFPQPGAATLAQAERAVRVLPRGEPVVVDGLAFGVMDEAAQRLAEDYPLIGLVHHPLALESGLSAAAAQSLRARETLALRAARAVIATSAATAEVLARDYAVPRSRITVAPPGTDVPAPAPRDAKAYVSLLCVGAVVPRKGHDLLVAALERLRDLRWRLTIAGALDRSAETAAALRASVAAKGLAARIEIMGAVSAERLAMLYREADVFVLASRFEGYGMAYAEAIAHGLPVVGTTAGAIPDTVPAAAALLVAPDDIAALAGALRRLLQDAPLRQRMGAAAWDAAARLPRWQDSAELFSRAIEAVR